MKKEVCLAALLVALLTACGTHPHDNFRGHLTAVLGTRVDDPAAGGYWVRSKYFQGSQKLPNGNIENKYRYTRTCRYFFEYDPETMEIVSWRFEGEKDDCIIGP